ncbi:hypothetical protein F2Q68_00020041 [Brassica cretica]|uniref:Uncharacterized protein n=1 Tax=Brassica cretica TaxID=69181 RepID=A0A8S9FZH0_BRACR|nr:hypothetical protein F2Q68_00020041 [Brassica cretica]
MGFLHLEGTQQWGFRYVKHQTYEAKNISISERRLMLKVVFNTFYGRGAPPVCGLWLMVTVRLGIGQPELVKPGDLMPPCLTGVTPFSGTLEVVAFRCVLGCFRS